MNQSPEIVKYLIRTAGRGGVEESIIELPADWELTFSSVNPTSQTARSMEGYCLRVYRKPGKKLVAVFDSVISFRDLSIPLVRKVRSEVGNASWTADSLGNFTEERQIKVDYELEPGDF